LKDGLAVNKYRKEEEAEACSISFKPKSENNN